MKKLKKQKTKNKNLNIYKLLIKLAANRLRVVAAIYILEFNFKKYS